MATSKRFCNPAREDINYGEETEPFQFKALELNRKILEGRGELPIAEKKEKTEFREFSLSTTNAILSKKT